jgi:hypothetical protein
MFWRTLKLRTRYGLIEDREDSLPSADEHVERMVKRLLDPEDHLRRVVRHLVVGYFDFDKLPELLSQHLAEVIQCFSRLSDFT